MLEPVKVKCIFLGYRKGIVESKKPQDLIDYHSTRDREDSNEAASAVAVVKKIYSHESLTFDNTFSCKVISTDISKIIRKPLKTGKHGHEERKSTKEARDAKPKAGKVKKSKLWSTLGQFSVNKSQP
ncbi:hypothetical protein Tco_0986826 [Tanacetum coccineum]